MPQNDLPIFVFGSNLKGRHGKGAALYAKKFKGAEYGVGVGRTGMAYAIPTKDGNLFTLTIEKINKYVQEFIVYAKEHPELVFNVTQLGTGLAKHKHEDIAPLFITAPTNCKFSVLWQKIIDTERNNGKTNTSGGSTGQGGVQ